MKIFSFILIIAVVMMMFMGCEESKDLTIDGKTIEVSSYGWLNEEEKNEKVVYKIDKGTVVLSIIFIESIIVPVLLTGWYLYEPVGIKTDTQL
jgi:hypothetical protein